MEPILNPSTQTSEALCLTSHLTTIQKISISSVFRDTRAGSLRNLFPEGKFSSLWFQLKLAQSSRRTGH